MRREIQKTRKNKKREERDEVWEMEGRRINNRKQNES